MMFVTAGKYGTQAPQPEEKNPVKIRIAAALAVAALAINGAAAFALPVTGLGGGNTSLSSPCCKQ